MDNIKLKSSLIKAIFIMCIFIIYAKLFGNKNIIIGIILGIAAISFLRRDFTKDLLYRTITFLLINLYLVISAYLSTLNIYTGVILNFITIFIVTYIYMNDFKSPTSYMFLMIYVFMISIKITAQEVPIRLIAISLGIILIIMAQILINKSKLKEKSNTLIKSVITELKNQIDDLIEERYDEKKSIKINQQIRFLIASSKIKRHRHFKHNKAALKQFNIGICLARLNVIINHIANDKNDKNEKYDYLKNLKKQIDNIYKFSERLENIEEINLQIEKFAIKYKKSKLNFVDESICVLQIFKEIINENEDIILNELYKVINIPSSFELLESMKENFNIKSLRFRYSIKLAVSISLIIFLVGLTNISHQVWIIISCYVILQPYQEDGIIKARKRFIGVSIGAVLFFIAFSLMKGKIIILSALFLSFVGYFYFSDYSKKVIMTTILSLSMASMTESIQTISINRFLFVTCGIFVGLLFNKYLLPYNKDDCIKELKYRYKKNTSKILKELEKIKQTKIDILNLINLSTDRNKIEHNLILNSKEIHQSKINKFIYEQNIKISDEKYLILKYLYKNYNKENRMEA